MEITVLGSSPDKSRAVAALVSAALGDDCRRLVIITPLGQIRQGQCPNDIRLELYENQILTRI